jgi:hypothetical protein
MHISYVGGNYFRSAGKRCVNEKYEGKVFDELHDFPFLSYLLTINEIDLDNKQENCKEVSLTIYELSATVTSA